MSIRNPNSGEPETWLQTGINAFLMLGGQAYLSEVYEYVHTTTDRKLTTHWRDNIRARIYTHSSDSKYYKPYMGADIFWLVGKRGKGLWGVRPEWLRANGMLDPTFPLSEQTTSIEDALCDGLGDQEDDYEIIRSAIYQLKRNQTRVRLLKELYSSCCQVCGTTIRTKTGRYVEVHHIRPRNRYSGPDHRDNMVVLCPNHHREFDLGVLCINSLAFRLHHLFSSEVDGQLLSPHESHKLNSDHLEFAFNEIYNS